MNRASHFLTELFRRKVIRLLCAYIAVFWLLSQGFASLFPVLGIPDFYLKAFMITGAAAFPLAALISWKYNFVLPALVRDPQDVGDNNPPLSWARNHHYAAGAGHIVLSWTEDGKEHSERFQAPVTIGRDPDNTIRLTDKHVSRYHVVFWAENGHWHVRDLDSTNGTYVDSKRVTSDVKLPRACELRFHHRGPSIRVAVESVEATAVVTETH